MVVVAEDTVATILKQGFELFSASEKKIARALLAEYPVAGLEPVSKLAERSGVSAPTVLRLLTKLGIHSYPEFQARLRNEISMSGSGPIDQYREKTPGEMLGSVDEQMRSYETALVSIRESFRQIPPSEFEAVVDLLADKKRRLWLLGGRFSRLISEYFALHLQILRPSVRYIGANETERSVALLDIKSGDVVFAFDYRRYQESTVRFAQRAKASGATLVVFTDPALSPAVQIADHVLATEVESVSPFDTIAPSLVLAETLVTALTAKLGNKPIVRIETFDALEEPVEDPQKRSQ